MNKITEEFSKLTLEEQRVALVEMTNIKNTLYWETYEHVDIFNSKGNISQTIQEETGFNCYWRQSELGAGYIGTNVIVIPKEKITEQLKQELKLKYNNL